MRNTKWLKNGKFRKAILSAFYNISQRNFGILLILWCSFKLWWNFCLDQNFSFTIILIVRTSKNYSSKITWFADFRWTLNGKNKYVCWWCYRFIYLQKIPIMLKSLFIFDHHDGWQICQVFLIFLNLCITLLIIMLMLAIFFKVRYPGRNNCTNPIFLVNTFSCVPLILQCCDITCTPRTHRKHQNWTSKTGMPERG
jgi:hypothetical protein